MAIWCVSWLNGTTGGAGTPADPMKSISEVISASPGDEIRVEANPPDVVLSGILTFTDGNTKIPTSVDLTAEVFPGDFVKSTSVGNSGYWAVTSVTATELGLDRRYSGPNDIAAGVKLVPTDTGNASSSSEKVQQVINEGASGSPLIISGGWNPAFDIKTGTTYFRQGVIPYTSVKNGYGLYIYNRKYIELSDIHFLRYYYGLSSSYSDYFVSTGRLECLACQYGIYVSTIKNCEFGGIICNANYNYGFYCYNTTNINIDSLVVCSNGGYASYIYSSLDVVIGAYTARRNYSRGLRSYYMFACTFENLLIEENGSYGVELYRSNNNIFATIETNHNMTYGIRFYYAYNNTITRATVQNESTGIHTNYGFDNKVFHLTTSANGNDISALNIQGMIPGFTVIHYNAPDVDKYIFNTLYGNVERIQGSETLDGDGFRFCPLSVTDYIYHIWTIAAAAGANTDLSIYLKKTAVFSGECSGAAFYMGVRITDWVEFNLTEDYEKYTVSVSGSLITDNYPIELVVRTTGLTSEYVYADGFPEYNIDDVYALLSSFKNTVESKLPDNYIMGSSDKRDKDSTLIDLERAVGVWALPEGCNATNWIDEENVIDGSLDTYSYIDVLAYNWSDWAGFTVPEIESKLIRFYASTDHPEDFDQVNIEAYYGDVWHPVYNGAWGKNEDWFTVESSELKIYEQIRIQFYNNDPHTREIKLHEIKAREKSYALHEVRQNALAIKERTDNLPDTPASQVDVAAILLATQRLLGLSQENVYIDQPVYDGDSNLTSARLRTYTDKVSVGTDNDVLETYQIQADGNGPGKFTFWKQVQV